MATSSEYLSFVLDCLAPLRDVTHKTFFGGTLLSCGGIPFAMIMDNVLYFAVDDASRPRYEALGSRSFAYDTRKGRVDVTHYYEVPVELDDEERFIPLAREAIEASARRPRKTPRRR